MSYGSDSELSTLKVGLVAARASAASPQAWSGTPMHFGRALERLGHQVEYFGPYGQISQWLVRAVNVAVRRAGVCGEARWEGLHFLQNRLAQQAVNDAAKRGCDVVLFMGWLPGGACSPAPLFFWTDGTVRQREETAPYWQSASRWFVQQCIQKERQTFRTARVLMASQWAARSVEVDYGGRAEVLPFGTNTPPSQDIEQRQVLVPEQIRAVCIGREWRRKGFDKAVQAIEVLRADGVDAHLTILGCSAPEAVGCPNWLRCVPNASKQQVSSELSAATVYLHPARSEPFGISLSEAAAHRVPVISAAVPAIAERFVHGENAILVPEAADSSDWAKAILEERDSGSRASRIENALETWHANWRWESVAERFVAFVRQSHDVGASCHTP